MTGFGEARSQAGGLAIAVEVRTINSRHFKLSLRTSEGYSPLEPEIEAADPRGNSPRHGAVNLRVDRRATGRRLSHQHGRSRELSTAAGTAPAAAHKAAIRRSCKCCWRCRARSMRNRAATTTRTKIGRRSSPVIREALAATAKMRADEGVALAADLAHNGRQIAEQLDAIARRVARGDAVVPVAAHRPRSAGALGTQRHGRAGRLASRNRACLPTVATSPKKSSACAAICSSTRPLCCSTKAPAASSSSSPRKWAARSTRSARKRTTRKSRGWSWRSRRRWSESASRFRTSSKGGRRSAEVRKGWTDDRVTLLFPPSAFPASSFAADRPLRPVGRRQIDGAARLAGALSRAPAAERFGHDAAAAAWRKRRRRLLFPHARRVRPPPPGRRIPRMLRGVRPRTLVRHAAERGQT